MISLMNHINSDRDNPMFALAFSTLKELCEYMSERHLDILVVDEKVAEQTVCALAGGETVAASETAGGGLPQVKTKDVMENKLTDGLGLSVKMLILSRSKRDENDCGMIFKYSRVSELISSILGYIDVKEIQSSRNLFRTYGVISPLGRCGKTTLAVSLCMNDDVRGGLYIGMEEYGSYQDDADALSNMIYLAKQRSCEFTDYMSRLTVDLGKYSVAGYLKSYIDAMELDTDDVRWMISQMREWGRYTTVAFDIGQAVLKDLTILTAFDEVLVPVLDDEISSAKVKAFEETLRRAELGKLLCRMRKVSVPAAAPGSAQMIRFIENEMNR